MYVGEMKNWKQVASLNVTSLIFYKSATITERNGFQNLLNFGISKMGSNTIYFIT